jgi:hypothetical protein
LREGVPEIQDGAARTNPDGLDDRFEDIYGEDVDDHYVLIRYRQDSVDEIDRTIIEVDPDRGDLTAVSGSGVLQPNLCVWSSPR